MGKTTVQTRIRGKAGAGRTDFWLLLQLAGVLLVLTVAVNYVFNYVGNAMDAQYAVSSWEYVYTNSQEAPTGRAVEWQTANAFTPLSREKTGAYLHLRGTVEGAQEERELILRTDYAPMRIALNGETVYDNHYGESAWVGNRYNAVVLPAGDGQIALEVALRLPFSAEFTAQIVPVGTHTGFRLNGGLIFAGIVLVLGLLAAVALPFLPVLRKKRRYGLAIAGLLVLYGLAAALLAVSGATYWVNFPQFYPLAAAVEIDVHTAQNEIIKEYAAKGDCVIIGRGADYTLKDMHPFRIFVYADMESKIARCFKREAKGEALSEKQLSKKIRQIDKKRKDYYEYYTGTKWGAKENYDLMINTSNVDIKELAHNLALLITQLREHNPKKAE